MTRSLTTTVLSPRLSPVALLLIGSLLCTTGCKTSEDSKAAAAQMTETAQALSEYYASLGELLKKTDQLYIVEEALLGLSYGDAPKKQIADSIAEIEKREKMAKNLASLADTFTHLTSPDAVNDAVTSATALQTELGTIKALNGASAEIGALTGSTQVLLTALQEHKEREAAKGMSKTVSGLDALFSKEMPGYESIDDQYLREAADFTRSLVQDGDVEESHFLKDTLTLFDLAPGVASPEARKKLDALALKQIQAKSDEQKTAFNDSTVAMEKSLSEMSRRIDLVANEKPMTFRAAPQSLATVKKHSAKAACTTP